MHENTKTRIIDAAGPIFAHKGFAATTVREICSAAKVNQAAINYYFGSKENLYKEVFQASYSTLTPWCDMTDMPFDKSEPLKDRIRKLVVRRAEEIFATELIHWKIQLMFRELNDPSLCCGASLQEYIIKDYRELYDILSEFFDPAIGECIRWKFIFSMLASIIYYRTSDWLVRKMIQEDIREEFFNAEQVAVFVVDSFFLAAAPYQRKQ